MVHLCNNDKWVLARSLKDMSKHSLDAHKIPEVQKKIAIYSLEEENHYTKHFSLR